MSAAAIGWVVGGQPDHLDRAVPLPAPPRAGGCGRWRKSHEKEALLPRSAACCCSAFAGFSLSAFKETLTPYVSYERGARGRPHGAGGRRARQGELAPTSTRRSRLYFTLKEPKTSETLRVRYKGLKPANFEDAISIVAIGRYDAGGQGVRGRQAAGEVPQQVPGRRGRRDATASQARAARSMDLLSPALPARRARPLVRACSSRWPRSGAMRSRCCAATTASLPLRPARLRLLRPVDRARRGVLLVLLLALRDFRIEYVSQYSGLDLPGHYQFAAFWAGQKGSFLIWLLWGALLGLLVRQRPPASDEPRGDGHLHPDAARPAVHPGAREPVRHAEARRRSTARGSTRCSRTTGWSSIRRSCSSATRATRHPLRLRHGGALAAATTTAGRRAPSPGRSAASWCSAPPS